MFGGPRCRAPNVNRDVLRDMIFKTAVVERAKIRNSEELQVMMMMCYYLLYCWPSGASSACASFFPR